MPSGRRYPPEIYQRAVERYAQGKSLSELSAEIKVPISTLGQWKRQKYPECWEKRKMEVKEKQQEFVKQEE